MSGTSFAAPVVSGAAAHILARNPTWTPDQVKGALMLTARPLPNADELSLGVGAVDAAAAAAVTSPPDANAALKPIVVSTRSGPMLDISGWHATVSADASWARDAWADASWARGTWGDGSLGE